MVFSSSGMIGDCLRGKYSQYYRISGRCSGFPVPGSPRRSLAFVNVDELIGITSEEGCREAAASMLCQCEATISAEGVMTLHELAALLGKGVLDVYIPLLYLMSDGKLVLWQEEFFGEILVQACVREADTVQPA